MVLARMIKQDEQALICDLAETYQIYDYKQLPVMMVAVFACGLRSNSRIMMKLSGQQFDTNTLLLISILDAVNFILWSKTKDAQKNKNKPKSMIKELNKKEKLIKEYNSGKDFLNDRENILNSIEKGDV